MRNLWTKGVKAMDRYGLTAGFPAGPQGHISIFFGVEGRTRTFISERASGAHALIEAAKAIQNEAADIAIVGGTEAPLTPLVWAAYHSSNLLPAASEVEDTVHQRTGMLIGEGSTFLVLEEREHALRRGVPILAEISGWSRGTDPYPLEGPGKQPGRGLKQIIRTSLEQADIQPGDVDVIFPAGPALAQEDLAEEAAIRSTFERSLPIAMPKTALGHLQGAATATDVAIATLALDGQIMPPTQEASSRSDRPISHALVLAGGSGGMHASLIVSKAE
jgi:3-oxoacyl-(acyl-carrier-protein) synthase